MSEITFPYANLDAAIQDHFTKLKTEDRTGREEAFRLLVNGYKTEYWRKKSRVKRDEKIDRALKLLKEHDEKNGTKADRQLGRK